MCTDSTYRQFIEAVVHSLAGLCMGRQHSSAAVQHRRLIISAKQQHVISGGIYNVGQVPVHCNCGHIRHGINTSGAARIHGPAPQKRLLWALMLSMWSNITNSSAYSWVKPALRACAALHAGGGCLCMLFLLECCYFKCSTCEEFYSMYLCCCLHM
jgi:hypothetical protein